MIRLTGGERKGMILTAPRGHQTRPATSRIRQWIFDVIGAPTGADLLDLFAGSGAVGLEALSRGAAYSLFVESWKPALDALKSNLEKTCYRDRAEVWAMDVNRAVTRLMASGRQFDLCFCDPPYAYEGLGALLEQSVLDLLVPGGTLIVEHRGTAPLMPGGLVSDREKSFGDTVISLWTKP
jgi:16S rRNA (guanine(966)-N(2))-methyltransferase RsmD